MHWHIIFFNFPPHKDQDTNHSKIPTFKLYIFSKVFLKYFKLTSKVLKPYIHLLADHQHSKISQVPQIQCPHWEHSILSFQAINFSPSLFQVIIAPFADFPKVGPCPLFRSLPCLHSVLSSLKLCWFILLSGYLTQCFLVFIRYHNYLRTL